MSTPMRKTLSLVRPWLGFLVLAAVMAVLSTAADQAVPMQIRNFVNASLQPAEHGLAWRALLLLGILMLVAQLLKLCQRLATEWAATRLRSKLFEQGVQHVLSQPLSWFHTEHSGALQVRLERATGAVCDVIKMGLADVLPPLVGVVLAVGLLLWSNLGAGLVATATVPILVLLTLAQARSQRGVRVSINEAREAQGIRVAEAILGIEQVKLFRAEATEARRAGKVAKSLSDTEMRHHCAMANWDIWKFVVERVGFAAALTLAILAASRSGAASGIGDVVLVVMLWDRVAEPIRHLHRVLDELGERAVLANSYLGILETTAVERQYGASPTQHRGEVSFDDVVFAYPGESQPVIAHLNLSVAAGRKVALVGRSGSGKSTLLRMLVGLAMPGQGSVRIDGQPVEPIEQQAAAATVGLLTQDVYVFGDTVAANITYGNGTASDEEVEEAARRAGLAEDIARLPDGYQTQLGQHGAGLSGGQRQRLALARVILQDPEIVAFDEPVSALDPENARRFFNMVLDVFRDKTVIVVTHNLDVLDWADEVVLLRDGSVVEAGPPARLLTEASSETNELRHGLVGPPVLVA